MLLELMRDRKNALLEGSFSRASFLSIRIAHLLDADDIIASYKSFSDLCFIKESILTYDVYKKKIPSTELALALLHPEVVFDCKIPISWNLDSDLFIIDSKIFNEEIFVELFAIIGQRRFLFIRSKKKSEYHLPGDDFDVKGTLAHLGPVLPGRLSFLLLPDCEDSKNFEKKVREGLTDIKVNGNTIKHFEENWLENIVEGIPFFSTAHCASELKNFLHGKDVLIISPGPSLTRCREALKKMRTKFIIVAVAQAVPALVRLGITPDFVMVFDPLDYSNVLLGLKLEDVQGLIAYEAIHKNFLGAGFRNIFIISPPLSPIANFQLFGGEPIGLIGGSVSVQACSFAAACGASTVALLGQDLCLQAGVQYAVGSSDGKSIANGDIEIDSFGELFVRSKFDGSVKKLYPILGQEGEALLSPGDYCLYKNELEMIAEEFSKMSEVVFINFSKGGAQINGFENQRLESYVGSGNRSEELVLRKNSDYLSKLDMFASECLKKNREFKIHFENLEIDDDRGVAEFLSIPAIRSFGRRELIDFFSRFETFEDEGSVLRNESKLKQVMEAALSAHEVFFKRVMSKIASLQ